MSVVTGLQMALVSAALAKAGAKWTPLYRQSMDANGVPVSGPERIGCMLGMRYTKGQMSALTIDIPGVIVRPDTPRFEGIARGCVPMAGDRLCICGKRVAILDVMDTAPPLYVLTLEG